MSAVANESVLTLLECPVCLENIIPPVKQCLKGHLVCQECFPRLHHCPTCRGGMSQERNLAMEQVAHLLLYPCRYSLGGCPAMVSLSEKSSHERNCSFLHLKCPFHGQCTFSGPLSQVRPHLKTQHNVIPVKMRDDGHLFYRAKAFSKRPLWTFLFEWQSILFKLSVKHVFGCHTGRTDDKHFLIAGVQSVGAEDVAEGFQCHIGLFDPKTRRNAFRPKRLHVVCATKDLESLCNVNENSNSNNTSSGSSANTNSRSTASNNTGPSPNRGGGSGTNNTASAVVATNVSNGGRSSATGVNKDAFKSHVLVLGASQAKNYVSESGNLCFFVEMNSCRKHCSHEKT